MPSDLPLNTLQQWMYAVVAHPGDVYEGLASDAAQRHVRDVTAEVLPSATLEPAQRIGIYHGMYMLRMIEALEGDYPALARFLGHHAFEHLVRDYVQEHPSHSWTFNRLGDHLPEFIAASKLRRRIFLSDLARLELAMTEVFDEAEAAPLGAEAIGTVPPESLESLRFTTIPGLRLLALRYDANAAFQAFRDDEQIPVVRGKTWVAVHRRDYGVFRMALTQPAFSFLESLAGGASIGEAIVAFHRRFRRLPEQDELFSWFRDWSAAGLFASMTNE